MKTIITVFIIAAALNLSPILMATDAAAGGSKGLRVFLTINTNLVGQPVEMDTYQFDRFIVTHDSYMDNGLTEIELDYEKGEIVNGEFEVCVNAIDAQMEKCTFGYDSEAKEPVYINVDLFGSNSPQPVDQPTQQDQSQAQSSNSENTNNNALSQSQETTIIICNDGKCKEQ